MKALGALVFLAGALGTACSKPPNSLEGSVSVSHDLSFDEVELRYLSDQAVYQLSYFKRLDTEGNSDDTDTVAKITFNEPSGGVVVDAPIDLADEAAGARVERITADGDPFPTALSAGSVTFHSAATVGEAVSGEFAATFDNGQTLNGTFETELLEIAF